MKNGYNHFFAFEEKKKVIAEWNLEDVLAWAEDEKFYDYLNIFKSEKVTGKVLLGMSIQYLEDVLGVVNVKIQQKMLLQIQEATQLKPETRVVYGWGKNQKCQLGAESNKFVSNPIRINLPMETQVWDCEGNYTLIRNVKSKQIFINTVNESGNVSWKAVDVQKGKYSIYKDSLIVIMENDKVDKGQDSNEEEGMQKKKKLRTAKNIIDQINWDEKIAKDGIRVGYFDKFMGNLQTSFHDLMGSQIKEYRIEYFKKENNEIIWSKKDRIDTLQTEK